MSDVTAITIGPARTKQPADVAAAAAVPDLGGLRDAAVRAGTRLLWLLDATAVPLPGTLSPLLEHAGGPAVSMPVGAGGAPVEAAIGRIDDDDPAALLERVAERCAPLRHTPVVSMLVERRLVEAVTPPDTRRFGPYAGSEWTARLFADRPGLLVPASRVELTAPLPRSPLAALRMARGPAWRRGEAAREAYRALAWRATGRAR